MQILGKVKLLLLHQTRLNKIMKIRRMKLKSKRKTSSLTNNRAMNQKKARNQVTHH
jgi:hypothetical protein